MPFSHLWLVIFPELGVRGAAYTGIIAQSLGVILGLRVLLGARSRLTLSFKEFHLGIGYYLAHYPHWFSGFYFWHTAEPEPVLSPDIHGAVWCGCFGGTCHYPEIRDVYFYAGDVVWHGVLVGQNLGAKKPERAEKSAWLAVGLVEAFVVAVSLVMFIWTGPIVRLFNNEPAMDAVATQFIHIAVVGWVLMGFMFVLMNSLQGAGDTVPTMIISIITTWVITIPLAYFLPRYTSWGAISIRWADCEHDCRRTGKPRLLPHRQVENVQGLTPLSQNSSFLLSHGCALACVANNRFESMRLIADLRMEK